MSQKFPTIPVLLLFIVVNSISGDVIGPSTCNIDFSDEIQDFVPKSTGSNGFRVWVKGQTGNQSGEAKAYTLGEYYTVVLEGRKTLYTAQAFRGFTIVAISADSGSLDSPIGSFQVKEGSTLKWAPNCYHAVSHTTLQPKVEIEVVWQAPSTNTGCVQFVASILEYPDLWYSGDGALTKMFCPEAGADMKKPKPTEECCACDEVKYEMSFTGYWSRQTHPKDFPTLEHLTHFSDIVGATHSDRYSMWAEDTYATDGMKQLAEWGDTQRYEEELKEKGREVRTIIKAKGLWFPNVRGTAKTVFRADRYHHFISLASMFGPSPDWIVGISSADLCLKNCTWTDEIRFNLTPWDAGTDGGVTYMAPNNPTIPLDKIKPITTKMPADQRAPFYNPNLKEVTPLGLVVLKKQQNYPMTCKPIAEYAQASQQESNSETSEDLEYRDRRECMVGPWTPWSLCSATCGKGLRMRNRLYKNPVKAKVGECKRQLNEKQFCNADISVCSGSEAFNDVCTTTEWGDWTDCTVTCGKGLRVRSRNYNHPMAMKKCDVQLMEKEMCIGQAGDNCDAQIDPACRTTYWSDWSPCSQSCGDGLRVRTRLLFFPENKAQCSSSELVESSSCNVQNCEIFLIRHAQEICQQPVDVGACQGVFPRYYFDHMARVCKRFVYTGCRGNKNNFESQDHCKTACLKSENGDQDGFDDLSSSSLLGAEEDQSVVNNDGGIQVHCMVTEWSPWSDCTATCNAGMKHRTRMVKVAAKNGGHPCPRDLIQKSRCRLRPCPNECRMTTWTEWSACSVTCGASGYQMRMRRGRNSSGNGRKPAAKPVARRLQRNNRAAQPSASTPTNNCPLTQVDKRACNVGACSAEV